MFCHCHGLPIVGHIPIRCLKSVPDLPKYDSIASESACFLNPLIWGVSSLGGYPKAWGNWMVYIENPTKMDDNWG